MNYYFVVCNLTQHDTEKYELMFQDDSDDDNDDSLTSFNNNELDSLKVRNHND